MEGPPLTDVLGTLVALDEATLTVERPDRVPVVVPLGAVTAARVVRAARRAILALETVAARGWRAGETLSESGWLLRADGGFTGRANSAIQLRTVDEPFADAVGRITAFYRDRGLTPRVHLPLPVRSEFDAGLAALGWTVLTPSLVLTKPLRPGLPPPEGPSVRLDVEPDAGWLAGYHYRGGDLPGSAVALLRRHETVRFASLREGGQVVAIARGAVDEGWLGVTAVEVGPTHRRAGAATRLMLALERWGASEGATSAYLQVEATNTGAQALYRRLGYAEHHRYQYRLAPH